MSVEALKSTSITNLDASPVVANTAGKGAQAPLLVQSEYVTVSPAASATSTYRMIRLATTVKVKLLVGEWEAMGAGRVNLSLYYSDGYATDGSPPAQAGGIVSGGDQFFASDADLTSANLGTALTNESGNYPLSKRNMTLWEAVGLSADPGGFFDLVYVVHTTDITTGAARLGLRAEYTA
jgi:hypothetical protein